MRFLVTGGGGFIGSHLVDRIIAEGHDVVVLDNFASGKKSNLEAAAATGKMRLVEGTILDNDDLNDAMHKVDVVFHLAVECVRKSIGDPVGNHHANATGTLMTLEAARRHKVSRFIYCSSSEVYGNTSMGALSEDTTVCAPTTVYGASKLVGELYTQAYLRTYGMETAVVRPFNAFGPREHDQGVLAEVIPRFVIRVLNGKAPIVFGDGSNGRDFTYVTDTADGLWRTAFNDRIVGQTDQPRLGPHGLGEGGRRRDPAPVWPQRPHAGTCGRASGRHPLADRPHGKGCRDPRLPSAGRFRDRRR